MEAKSASFGFNAQTGEYGDMIAMGIVNPVKVARRVMEHTPHVMLVSKGAREFATEQGMDLVDDPDGRIGAAPRVLVLVGNRQAALEPGQLVLETGQTAALGRVGDGDERLEGGLVAEQAVLVRLVRTNNDLEITVEIHPVHVRLEVVVAQEGRGAGSFNRGAVLHERAGPDEPCSQLDNGVLNRDMGGADAAFPPEEEIAQNRDVVVPTDRRSAPGGGR